MQRADLIARIQADGPFDLLVVGGGATGLGTALDAAARGYRTALIEQSDFAKGTSSRSTKLVHGGVRYLRQGNLPLVLEALRERGRLLQNAPHLVQPLGFVIPTRRWQDQLVYGVGMKVYDRLAGRFSLGVSRRLSRSETIERLPTVNTEGLTGGVLYHDAQFDDARLAVALARAAVEHGALLANYCRCVGLLKEGSRVTGAEARDEETGETFSIRARAVINATGVFVDTIRQLDAPDAKALVTVSQGIHCVLPARFLPGTEALMVPKTSDGRVLFAVPWQGRVVVGTTDTPVDAASLEPRALASELRFVLGHARQHLSESPRDEDVLSVFAGLRPLVKKAGSHGDTAALSREHAIRVSASGLITITGGKWTTYRRMAADVVDHAARLAGLPKRPCVTAELSLDAGGSPAIQPELAQYGRSAEAIHAMMAADPALAARVHPALETRRAEVVWHVRHEMARTVEDVLARRTRALLLDARASLAAAPAVAALLAQELGRDADWIRNQLTGYERLASGYLMPGQ